MIQKYLESISYKFPKGYPDMSDPKDVVLLEKLIKEFTNQKIIISEVALSPTQLEKPFHSELKDKFDDRGEFFLDKINNNQPFEMNDGSSIIIDKDKSTLGIEFLKSKEYNSLGGLKKYFTDTEGKEYSLSKFKKSKEFGSGKGMGGGSVGTMNQESAQSIVNAIAYNVKGGKIEDADLTDENINKAYSFSDVNGDKTEITNFITNPKWRESMILTANLLISEYPNKNYIQHRGSKFVDSIYNSYKIAKKAAGLSMQSDKWNPADIWMVDKSITSTTFPTEINELNSLLNKLYTDGKLIGVSLKKVGKDAHISVYNLDESTQNKNTFEGTKSAPTNKQVDILFDAGKITFRTFNYATNFAGEINGKHAQHGKVGQGPINDILSKNNVELLPKPALLKPLLQDNDEETIKEFHSNYEEIVENIPMEQFNELRDTKGLDWQVSKYLGTRLGHTINIQSKDKQDNIISNIVGYASSVTSNSSVFIKIS